MTLNEQRNDLIVALETSPLTGEAKVALMKSFDELAAIRSAEMPEEPEDFVIYRPFDDATYVPESYAKALRAFALRMKAEAEANKTDAERYRWLRAQKTVPYPSDLNPGESQNIIVFWDGGQALDAAIDKERTK